MKKEIELCISRLEDFIKKKIFFHNLTSLKQEIINEIDKEDSELKIKLIQAELYKVDEQLLHKDIDENFKIMKDSYENRVAREKNKFKKLFEKEILNDLLKDFSEKRYLYDVDLAKFLIKRKANVVEKLKKLIPKEYSDAIDFDKTLNRYCYNIIVFNDAVCSKRLKGIAIMGVILCVITFCVPFASIATALSEVYASISIAVGVSSAGSVGFSTGFSMGISYFYKILKFLFSKLLSFITFRNEEERCINFLTHLFCLLVCWICLNFKKTLSLDSNHGLNANIEKNCKDFLKNVLQCSEVIKEKNDK